MMLTSGLKEPLKMGVNLILIFAIDYQLAILSLAILPLTTYIIYKLGRGIKERSLHALEKTATLTSVLQESLGAIRIIKAFATEKFETERFWNASRDVFRYLMKIAKLRASSAPVIEFIYTTAFAGILVADPMGLETHAPRGYPKWPFNERSVLLQWLQTRLAAWGAKTPGPEQSRVSFELLKRWETLAERDGAARQRGAA